MSHMAGWLPLTLSQSPAEMWPDSAIPVSASSKGAGLSPANCPSWSEDCSCRGCSGVGDRER
eukprot:15471772-Alexandrium_andersonii.AAC.1